MKAPILNWPDGSPVEHGGFVGANFELVEVEPRALAGSVGHEIVRARQIGRVAGRMTRRVEFAALSARARVREVASALRRRRAGHRVLCKSLTNAKLDEFFIKKPAAFNRTARSSGRAPVPTLAIKYRATIHYATGDNGKSGRAPRDASTLKYAVGGRAPRCKKRHRARSAVMSSVG